MIFIQNLLLFGVFLSEIISNLSLINLRIFFSLIKYYHLRKRSLIRTEKQIELEPSFSILLLQKMHVVLNRSV